MSRCKLLLNHSDTHSFSADYILPLLSKYFDIVYWQPNTTYGKSDHVLCINTNRFGILPSVTDWYKPYLNAGYKIVIENLWETESFLSQNFSESDSKSCFVAHNQNWFWYHESLLYTSQNLNNYRPNKTYQKLALMPIRFDRDYRKELVIHLSALLDRIIWSYVDHGRYLPEDLPYGSINFFRHFNEQWYDSTYFSIVAETLVDGPEIFVTEKTFKPIAAYHPFAVLAQPGHLQYVRNLGFETFGNLFDESYDSINDWMLRLQALVKTIKEFDPEPYNTTTLQKLEHNHNRFYDQTLVESQIVSEIIHPILEYVESK